MKSPATPLLLGAALAPLVTWLPMAAILFPVLGLPPYAPMGSGAHVLDKAGRVVDTVYQPGGIDLWGMHVLLLVGFLCAAFILKRDTPLALMVAVIGLVYFYRGARIDSNHSLMFVLGALLLLAARTIPFAGHHTVIRLLVVLGVFQAVYMVGQYFGHDLMYLRLSGDEYSLAQKTWIHSSEPVKLLGTLGTVDAASAYVAITAPLMPPVLMPIAILAVILGKSSGAVLALTLALILRFRHTVRPLYATFAGVASFGCIAWWASHNAHTLPFNKLAQSILGRWMIWDFSVSMWWQTASPFFGWGLGGWSYVIPRAQASLNFAPPGGELWREGHNEPLQFVLEAGFVGGALLAWWLWDHRSIFTHRTFGPSVAALGVSSLTFFPWHVVPVALLGLLVVGCASTNSEPEPVGGSA